MKEGAPSSVLTEGYYSKLRHPMYGTFIMMYASCLLSTRSLIGILITLVLMADQYLNAVLEDW